MNTSNTFCHVDLIKEEYKITIIDDLLKKICDRRYRRTDLTYTTASLRLI